MSGPEGNSAGPVMEPLTRREREILSLLAQGLSAPEIAERLTIATSSVKSHIQHLYSKLSSNSKRQAVARARELGLLDILTPPAVASAAKMLASDSSRENSRRHNLPQHVTQFFGRETERVQIRQRLAAHRLVALTGAGGIGKTRMALHVAQDALADFADSAWLVELAPLSEPALVPQQVAAVLGLRDEGRGAILDSLIFFLRDRRALVVLDNCEHLLEACARLGESLLHNCPWLRLLVTSREPLGIAGEAVYSLPSLPFPDSQRMLSLESVSDYAAVRLFVDRARLALPGYELTLQNAAWVARICQRLDGIPLAIEMVAARIHVLTAEQLAGRLDDAFRLLTGGSRTALPRQQTLQATIDWSYQLLSEPERALFRRLSVFHGGWTLEAAEAVAADQQGKGAGSAKRMATMSTVAQADVLDLLTQLVSKSLVVAERQPGAGMRYRMLEPIRQYAWQWVSDAGEADDSQARHLDYFLWLAERTEPELFSAAQATALARLEREHDNFRAALEWRLAARSDDDKDLRLAGALYRFWNIREHFSEGYSFIEAALARHDSSDRSLARAKPLLGAASLGLRRGQDERYALLTECVEFLREIGLAGKVTLPWAVLRLAQMAQGHGEGIDSSIQAKAPALYQESATLFGEIGDKWGRAQALNGLAFSLHPYLRIGHQHWKEKSAALHLNGLRPLAWNDHSSWRSLFEESLALFREVGDGWNQAYPLAGLAAIALYEGDPTIGRALLEERLAIYRDFRDRPGIIGSLERLGTEALAQDDWERAASLYEESLALDQELEFQTTSANLFNELAEIARRQEKYSEAERLFLKSMATSQKLGNREDIANSLDGLGRLAWSRGDYATAGRLQREAFALRREASHPVSLLQSIQSLAILAEMEGRGERAATLFGAMADVHTAVDYSYLPTWRAEAERSTAKLRERLGEGLFAETFETGRALTLEQAVEYAVDAQPSG